MTTPMPPAGSTKRRTVLKAAAWSAPVIAVAAATPAASASTDAAVDVYLLPPNAGDVLSFYSSDLLTSYSYGSFIGFGIANDGTEDAPAGTIVQITYDPRIFAYNEAPTVWVGGDEHELAYEVNQTAPDSATLTITVDVPIPAGASYESGTAPSVSTHQSFLLFYPDDTVGNPQPYSDVVMNSADTNDANNSRGPYAPTVHESGPYMFELSAETTTVETSSCDMTVPQTVSVKNSGTGTPDGNLPVVSLDLDLTAITDVTVKSATIDGAAISGFDLVAPTEESSSWWIAIDDAIPVGKTLELSLDYTVAPDAGLDPVNSGYAGVTAKIWSGDKFYSYDFWAYRGEFPYLTYENAQCQI